MQLHKVDRSEARQRSKAYSRQKTKSSIVPPILVRLGKYANLTGKGASSSKRKHVTL